MSQSATRPGPGPGGVRFSCFIIGETTLAVRCGELLLARGHRILGIITDNSDVARWAADHGVRRIDPDADFAADLVRARYDYLFSIVNERILPASVVASPRRLAINYHDAPLPRYAGMHATSWAIMAGETSHGVTWHVASDKVDAGAVVRQQLVAIDPDDTALSLNAKCYDAAVESFGAMIGELANGTARLQEQDLSRRTYFGRHRRPPAAGILDWRRPAAELSALVRALDFGPYANPLGRAKIRVEDCYVIAGTAAPSPSRSDARPGTVVALDEHGVTVAVADGDLRLGALTTLSGLPLGPTELPGAPAVGTVLPSLPADEAERIGALDGGAVVRAERFWSRRLATLRPVPAPFADPQAASPGEPRWMVRDVAVPPGFHGPGSSGPNLVPAELVAALAIYLGRINREGEIDLAVRMPSIARDGLHALFATVLRLRLRTDEAQSFREMVTAVQAELDNVARRGTYARDLVDRHPPLRNRGGAPRFPVQIDLSPFPAVAPLGPHEVADLRVELDGGTSACRLTYREGVIAAPDAARIAEQLETLFAGIVAAPNVPVAQLPFVPDAERRLLIEEWNDTARPYPRDMTLHGLVEAQVVRTPDAVAVVMADAAVSYAELDARAATVAARLRAAGVGPGVLVGVCTGRTAALVAGFLGVLKAGGAYVPLDPEYPPERLRFMIEDARIGTLVVEEGLSGAPHPPDVCVIALDTAGRLADDDGPNLADPGRPDPNDGGTRRDARPEDPAYVIYTSGSTGKPKGAVVPHRGVVNYLAWAADAYGGAGHGAPVHSSPAFDLTVTSLYVPLVTGTAVHLLDERLGVEALAATLRANPGYTLVKLTPAHLDLLRQQLAPEEASGVAGTLVVGGENLVGDALDFWRRHAPATAIVNEYGPTETVVGCCAYRVAPDDRFAGSVPIGRPIANTRLYVLDENGELLPRGLPGELHIGGAGVGLGYLNRPELTAERFVPDRFDASPGARMYRTGDLVRYRADGNLEFLGRLDGQVKVRGYRIELGEVEAALAAHPSIVEAAAAVHGSAGEARRLVGYYVARPGAAPDAHEVAGWMAGRLPAYMLPAAYVELPALPLTANGKVDRRALPVPRPQAEGRGGAALDDPVQRGLVEIWEDVLGVTGIGTDDRFFDLGGQSLSAARMMARVRETFGYAPALGEFFRVPTIGGLAELVAGEQEPTPRNPMEEIRPGGGGVPFFFAHGDLAHDGAYFHRMVAHLDPGRPIWTLHPHDPGGPETIAGMADDFVARVLAVRDRGAFLLGGTCNGGVVAFEMARRLRAMGHQTDVLMLAMVAENVRVGPVLRAVDRALRATDRLRGRRDDASRRQRFLAWRERILRFRDRLPAEGTGRLRLAGAAAREFAGVAWRRIRGKPDAAPPDRRAASVVSATAPDESEQLLRERYRLHVRAMQEYLPSRYDGPITLLLAGDRVRGGPAGGWDRYCTHAEVHILPGEHHTILESSVAVTAVEINRWLRER